VNCCKGSSRQLYQARGNVEAADLDRSNIMHVTICSLTTTSQEAGRPSTTLAQNVVGSAPTSANGQSGMVLCTLLLLIRHHQLITADRICVHGSTTHKLQVQLRTCLNMYSSQGSHSRPVAALARRYAIHSTACGLAIGEHLSCTGHMAPDAGPVC